MKKATALAGQLLPRLPLQSLFPRERTVNDSTKGGLQAALLFMKSRKVLSAIMLLTGGFELRYNCKDPFGAVPMGYQRPAVGCREGVPWPNLWIVL